MLSGVLFKYVDIRSAAVALTLSEYSIQTSQQTDVGRTLYKLRRLQAGRFASQVAFPGAALVSQPGWPAVRRARTATSPAVVYSG